MANKKRLRQRIASIAAAAAVSLSSVTLSAFPSLTVYAAGAKTVADRHTGLSSGGTLANKLHINIVDSSAYGADRGTKGDMDSTTPWEKMTGTNGLNGYWDDGLSERDFLYTPEGLGTFTQRAIDIYKISATQKDTTFTTTNLNSMTSSNVARIYILEGDALIDFEAIDGKSSSYYGDGYVLECNTGFKLEDDQYYLFVENNGETKYNLYGYAANRTDGANAMWQFKIKGENLINQGLDVSYNATTMATNAKITGDDATTSTAIPLHDEILRANFSFTVVDKDLQSYASQGSANITGSLFAVYNISSKTNHDNGDPAHYVTIDKDGNGEIDKGEEKAYYPAYSESEINAAYDNYLSYLNDEAQSSYRKYSGALAGKNYDVVENRITGVTDSDYVSADGLFLLNGSNTIGPESIIPVMILKADSAGKVSTAINNKSLGLPVGNYMVVQIQAGAGYYIDENFRPIISVGYWGNGAKAASKYEGLVHTYDGSGYGAGLQKSSWGTGYYREIATAHIDSKDWKTADRSYVAYIPTSKTTDITKAFDNITNSAGQLGNGSVATYSTAYKSKTDIGSYIFGDALGSENGSVVRDRMAPISNTGIFVCQNPVIRAGGYYMIADSDDILHVGDYDNTTAQGEYIVEPQGDGSLDGAKFELTRVSATVNESTHRMVVTEPTNNNGFWSVSQKKLIKKGESIVYTVSNGRLTIPTDELPPGMYRIRQISAGEGYMLPGDEDYFIAYIMVTGEDEISAVFGPDQIDPNGNIKLKDDNKTIVDSGIVNYYKPGKEINDPIYLPNELMNGGEIFSVESMTVPSGIKVELSVFNISDHYVYTSYEGDNHTGCTHAADNPCEGGLVRYETYKYDYARLIAGKNLSYAKLLEIVEGWEPCDVQTVTVGSRPTEVEDRLPYGTYLIVVTGIKDAQDQDADYEITGDFMGVDSVDQDKNGDPTDIEFSTEIEDVGMLPKIDTVFVDAQRNIDSIKIAKTVYLRDIVELSQLEAGKSYILYGVVIDKETGGLLKPGFVKAVRVTAYDSTADDNSEPTIDGRNGALALLKDYESPIEGQVTKFTEFSDEYVVWLYNVQDYALAIGDNTLASYVTIAINAGNKNSSDTQYATSRFKEARDLVAGRLRYLAKGVDDTMIDGAVEAYVNFDALNTLAMEGKTLVAYEYLCADNGAINTNVNKAANTGEILAALSPELLASHRSINDEDQTVYLPTLDISAEASYTGSKTMDSSESVKANIEFGNIEPGNIYMLEVWLVDKYGATVPMVDDNGNLINSVKHEFISYDTQGEYEVTFEGLDIEKYNNQRLTVYATLNRVTAEVYEGDKVYDLITKGDADSMGYKITDKEPGKNQVDVTAPTVDTVLGDNSGRKVVSFDKTVTIADTVNYKGLVVGGSYIAELTLVDEEGTMLYDDSGNALKAEYRFIATKEAMTIKIPLTFKGTMLRGMNIIAFNDLYRITDNAVALVAQEHNVLEERQTIEATGDAFRIIISTVATNPGNNTHVVAATGGSAVKDDVNIRNLEPNTQYMAKTQLADSKTGQIITQFAPVETIFETDSDGRAKFSVNFTFNALVFKGRTLSVYQTIYDVNGDEILAAHTDYTDVNQQIVVPELDTVATADDAMSKTIVPTSKEIPTTNDPNGPTETKYFAVVLDTIKFVNLLPGNQYQLTTEVVAKNSGASVGSISTLFVPETSSGTTAVSIELDVTNYRGADLVVYEVLTDVYSGDEVATHRDLMDTDQTITIYGGGENETPKGDNPNDPNNPDNPGKPGEGTDINTGVDEKYGLFFGIGGGILAAAIALVVVLIYRRKKNGEN